MERNLKVSKPGSLRFKVEVLHCLSQIQSTVFSRRHFFPLGYFFIVIFCVSGKLQVYFLKIDSVTNNYKLNGLKQHPLLSQF